MSRVKGGLRAEVSEKYWSKLVTSKVYLDRPSDILAVPEAGSSQHVAAKGGDGHNLQKRALYVGWLEVLAA